MTEYVRPLVRHDRPRPDTALPLAGGALWFDRCAIHTRGAPPRVVAASELTEAQRHRLTAPRPAIAGIAMDAPRIMGILNVTPDSFSDGGQDADASAAAARAARLIADGAEILDVGGESTRPGSAEVPVEDEIARTAPVIAQIDGAPVSIDTRKRAVAEAAVAAGAAIVNDVAALRFDPSLADFVVEQALPVCVMHHQGTPETMQDNPRYEDVVLDVFDFLENTVAALEARGVPRGRIITDPGIGFGKTLEHNLALLEHLAIFHSIGCPILLGASRKGFIGTLSGEPDAAKRAPGSIAVALHGAAQGVQILRVHDVAETRQALTLWHSVSGSGQTGGQV